MTETGNPTSEAADAATEMCPTCGRLLGRAFIRRLMFWLVACLVGGTLGGVLFAVWWFGESAFDTVMGLMHIAAGLVLGLIPGLALGLRPGKPKVTSQAG